MGPKWPTSRTVLSLGLALGLSTAAQAYDLFHPVPAGKLHELNTDRPDKTESPVTLDAGHFQWEADLLSWHREQGDGLRSDALSVGAFNAKLGLSDSVDLQLVFNPADSERVEDLNGGDVQYAQGNGDLLLRLKLHLVDGEGLVPALGLMPFIKSPTAAAPFNNGVTEGGIILPFGWELPAGFGLGCMAEFDDSLNSSGTGFHIDSILSASFSRDLLGSLGAYLEYWTLLSGESGVENQQTVDSGLTWELVPGVQFDAGVNVGLTPASEDLNPFLGLTLRH